jgi:aryl-phospho-beta-D-glucosidase BglC (GH1 family)
MEKNKELIIELLEALKVTQWGFNHSRCPVCVGWNVGPYGETDYAHTRTCPVGLVIKKVEKYLG